LDWNTRSTGAPRSIRSNAGRDVAQDAGLGGDGVALDHSVEQLQQVAYRLRGVPSPGCCRSPRRPKPSSTRRAGRPTPAGRRLGWLGWRRARRRAGRSSSGGRHHPPFAPADPTRSALAHQLDTARHHLACQTGVLRRPLEVSAASNHSEPRPTGRPPARTRPASCLSDVSRHVSVSYGSPARRGRPRVAPPPAPSAPRPLLGALRASRPAGRRSARGRAASRTRGERTVAGPRGWMYVLSAVTVRGACCARFLTVWLTH